MEHHHVSAFLLYSFIFPKSAVNMAGEAELVRSLCGKAPKFFDYNMPQQIVIRCGIRDLIRCL